MKIFYMQAQLGPYIFRQAQFFFIILAVDQNKLQLYNAGVLKPVLEDP